MAAFYKYIKGYMSDGETTQYIFFNQAKTGEEPIKDNRPYFSGKNDATNIDYFVSEKGKNAFSGANTFSGTTTFTNKVTFEGATEFTADNIPNFQKGIDVKKYINISYESKDNPKFLIRRKDITTTEEGDLISYTTLVTFNDSSVKFEQALSSGTSVTAPFFNASSDRRLKTNINAVEDSVLPLIVSTPVYTFNYKKHPTIPVIGIMAQDVLNKNINDFNLVKESSSGYYEIKESKMIYILWKAVQEQQKQIEALQARLEGGVDGKAND